MNSPRRDSLARRVPGSTTVSSTLASVLLHASPRNLPSLLPKKARQGNLLLLVRPPPLLHPLRLLRLLLRLLPRPQLLLRLRL